MLARNRMENHRPIAESFRLGLLLTLTGGFLDGYTYIARGKVFANAQTGNMLFMGMNIANGEFSEAFKYFIPILFFAVGVILVEFIRDKCKGSANQKLNWRQIIILAEMIVLAVVAFVPSEKLNIFVTTAISFVCSMQVESFRKVHGNPYATTMCTGNLRSAAEHSYLYFKTKNADNANKALQYYVIITLFIIGAVIGMYTTRIFGEKAVLVCVGILAMPFFIMFSEKKDL